MLNSLWHIRGRTLTVIKSSETAYDTFEGAHVLNKGTQIPTKNLNPVSALVNILV